MAEDFLKRRILILRDLGAMEVCSSIEMGAPGASHLGTGDHGPKTDRSRPRSVPVNALVLRELSRFKEIFCHKWRGCVARLRHLIPAHKKAHKTLDLG